MKYWETPEYRIWAGIKTRCYNSNCDSYYLYGGRGIIVCYEWLNSFHTFLRDMGNRPSKKHSIERIDPDRNYCKENCKWASISEQARNRRNNIFIEYNGIKMIVADWETKLGYNPGVVSKRIKRGWSIQDALNKRYE